LFKSLKKIFQQNSDNLEEKINDLDLLAGLMIEAANTDGSIDEKEYDNILLSLVNVFKKDKNDALVSLDKALEEKNNSKSLYYYTSKFNKEFNLEKKILLIEALWEIVLTDGQLHDYEASFIRRLAGLLYISDIDSGNAKKRALDKITR